MLIAADTEGTGIDIYHGAKPFFVSISYEDHTQLYWEADVDPLTREPLWEKSDLEQIESILFEAPEVIWQNPNYDIALLRNIIPRFQYWDWSKTRCTLLGDHLLRSNKYHDLTSQAYYYLRLDLKPFEDAVEAAVKECRRIASSHYPDWMIAKEGLSCMPSAKETVWKMDMWLPRAICKAENKPEDHPYQTVLAEYANPDSIACLEIYKIQQEQIRKKGLEPIYQERLKVLSQRFRMETRGVTINAERLEELENKYQIESKQANSVCVNLAKSHGFDLVLPKNGVNKSLHEFSFNVLKLPVVVKTDKGKPSLSKTAIDEYLATLPIRGKQRTFIETLGAKRSRDTALSYMESYRRYWLSTASESSPWYILHPSLNPTGTDTLRWSSQGPNEQQISKKEGFNLRYAFGPAPGREWWSLDYENLELRIPAYEANERIMIDLFEKPDEPPFFGSNHLFSASIVYPDLFWPLADQPGAFKKKYKSTYYQWIKNFNFAVQYGALIRKNGWGTADRAAHKQGAHAMLVDRLTEMGKLNDHWIKFAQRCGYVETIPDREICPARGYPLWIGRKEDGGVIETQPLNYHVQGTACWVMLRAMDKVQEYLDTLEDCHITLQVHDELILDFPYKSNHGNAGKIRKVRSLMSQRGDSIGVPLTVGVEYHPNNWAEGETPKCLTT